MIGAATHGPSTLWYATRGAGAVTLVLLSASVVIGIAEARMWRPLRVSRATIAAVHRTLSLLALALLAVHVATTLLDPFPPIGPLTALVPFATDYRPLWMGLGTIASDLLVAILLTSLVRRRLGYAAWRAVHLLAYACWPVAIAHGLGTGSDTKSTWMLALTLGCTAAVVAALIGRLSARGVPRAARVYGAGALSVCTAAVAVWLPAGPLGRDWARRAGTPATVLTAFSPARPRARPGAVDPLRRPFVAAVDGRIRRGTSAGGTAIAELAMRVRIVPRAVLTIRLGGAALPGGGLRLRRSAVWLGPVTDRHRYGGRIDSLDATRLEALVGSRDGAAIRIVVDVALDRDTVTGRLRATPAGGRGP